MFELGLGKGFIGQLVGKNSFSPGCGPKSFSAAVTS